MESPGIVCETRGSMEVGRTIGFGRWSEMNDARALAHRPASGHSYEMNDEMLLAHKRDLGFWFEMSDALVADRKMVWICWYETLGDCDLDEARP